MLNLQWLSRGPSIILIISRASSCDAAMLIHNSFIIKIENSKIHANQQSVLWCSSIVFYQDLFELNKSKICKHIPHRFTSLYRVYALITTHV